MKCFNLECIIGAKLYGKPESEELMLEELVNKEAQVTGVMQVDAVVDLIDWWLDVVILCL